MSRKEQYHTAEKEKAKSFLWTILGYAAIAVGALVVINHLATKL